MRRMFLVLAIVAIGMVGAVGTPVVGRCDAPMADGGPTENVTCCCATHGGGFCCAEASFCGRVVPGCFCK